MDIKDIKNCYKFYLENETQLISSERYLSLSQKCKKAFSAFYANLLMNICSDFESLFRAYFNRQDDKQTDIDEMIGYIEKDESLKTTLSSQVSFNEIDYQPFIPLSVKVNQKNNKKTFSWWGANNKLKHNKMAYFFHANQENVISALAGLFVLLAFVCKSSLGDCVLYSNILNDKIFSISSLKSRFIDGSFIVAEEIEVEEE